ncbi:MULTISPECIES: hypothetical protein [Mammaliicoccus]|uniref:hypothetical protein n=1 Tax=Mammaliicoccus TaxID=2803850 RepID=UPI001EFB2D2D|nr:hypothetical protein [Mammaliicoccus fleurettii]
MSEKSMLRYKSSIEVFEEKFGDLPINKLTQLKYRVLLKEYGEGLYLTLEKMDELQIAFKNYIYV